MSFPRTLLYGFAISGCLLFAQGGDQAARLVRLNVVATATDLTTDDFKVTDDGKAQRIAIFRAPQPTNVKAGEFSNRPAPHTTAILFDLMNQGGVADRLDGSKRMAQSLKQLDSPESVYVYMLALDGKIVPIHPIELGAAPNKTWTEGIEATIAKSMKELNKGRTMGISDEEMVKKTYVALETIGKQLAPFAGRRDIVWVTSRIPFTLPPKTCSGDWIECALYVPHLSVTLDIAGVVVNPFSYSGDQGQALTNVGEKGQNLADQAKDVANSRWAMEGMGGSGSDSTTRTWDDMAGLTGGHAYFSADMRAVIKQLDAIASTTYVIAYEPHESWDSKFHKVKVTCERKAVKLDAKQRYYALPDTRPAPEKSQGMLVATYQRLGDVSDIGLRATVSSTAPNMAHIEMLVEPADLLLHESGGEYTGQLTVLLSARAAAGPQSDPTITPEAVKLKRDQLKAGIPVVRDFPIDAATQKVRIIILDQADNTVGSLTVPVSARH
jgi:VWFA-related protein